MTGILQLKITIKDSHPPIWRRIQIMDTSTFADLHNAIQDTMGWEDYHLHEFLFNRKKQGSDEIVIGQADDDDSYRDVFLDETTQLVVDWLGKQYQRCTYTYDFGDGWDHTVLFEKHLSAKEGEKYPQCLDGQLACPPEDSGGIDGYYYKLEALRDPKHQEHQETVAWMGKNFNPEIFDPSQITFRG